MSWGTDGAKTVPPASPTARCPPAGPLDSHLVNNVPVPSHHRHLRPPENVHDRPAADPLDQEQGRGRVARVVKPGVRNPNRFQHGDQWGGRSVGTTRDRGPPTPCPQRGAQRWPSCLPATSAPHGRVHRPSASDSSAGGRCSASARPSGTLGRRGAALRPTCISGGVCTQACTVQTGAGCNPASRSRFHSSGHASGRRHSRAPRCALDLLAHPGDSLVEVDIALAPLNPRSARASPCRIPVTALQTSRAVSASLGIPEGDPRFSEGQRSISLPSAQGGGDRPPYGPARRAGGRPPGGG